MMRQPFYLGFLIFKMENGGFLNQFQIVKKQLLKVVKILVDTVTHIGQQRLSSDQLEVHFLISRLNKLIFLMIFQIVTMRYSTKSHMM